MYQYGDYRKHIIDTIDNHKTISKGDLYDAFLDITERYLLEMISCLNYEKAFIDELGEEKGNQVLEQLATSNEALNSLELFNDEVSDDGQKIKNLLDYIDNEFRT